MNKMLKVVWLIILTCMLLVTGCSAPSVAQVGKSAPNFQLENLDGQPVSLSDFRGRPVLLNFWATWCPPCRGEMPYLQEVYEAWSGKGVVVLAINLGESPAQVKGFLETHNLSLPVLIDIPGDSAHQYNISSIPTSFFIDSDGIVREKVLGAFPSKETIETRLIEIMP